MNPVEILTNLISKYELLYLVTNTIFKIFKQDGFIIKYLSKITKAAKM